MEILGQQVHGYSAGHSLLASTVELSAADAAEVARLSDLSGLPSTREFVPYVTCYPLTSANLYAMSKTWPDLEARRAGCVLSRTLILDGTKWGKASVWEVAQRLTRPERDRLIDADVGSLGVSVARGGRGLDHQLGDFIERFYVEGIDPVIWPIAGTQLQESEFLTLSILQFAWPALRSQLAVTSCAFQPRRTFGRPFSVQFVPQEVVGRFASFSEKHIVGRMQALQPQESASEASLVKRVAVSLQSGNDAVWPLYATHREDLPPNRQILLRLATLELLEEKSEKSPLALVAMLDVWAVLAPRRDHAVDEKRRIAEDVFSKGLNLEPRAKIELLSSLLRRLARPPFSYVRNTRAAALSLLRESVHKAPGVGVDALLAESKPPRQLIKAVGESVDWNSQEGESLFYYIRDQSFDTFRRLIELHPESIGSFIDTPNETEASRRLTAVESWIDELRPRARRRVLASLEFFPQISLSASLLSQVLDACSPTSDVPLTFARRINSHISTHSAELLLKWALERPVVAREFYERYGLWASLDAVIYGKILPVEAASVRSIGNVRTANGKYKIEALEKFLEEKQRAVDCVTAETAIAWIVFESKFDSWPLGAGATLTLTERARAEVLSLDKRLWLTLGERPEVASYLLPWLLEGLLLELREDNSALVAVVREGIGHDALVQMGSQRLARLFGRRKDGGATRFNWYAFETVLDITSDWQDPLGGHFREMMSSWIGSFSEYDGSNWASLLKRRKIPADLGLYIESVDLILDRPNIALSQVLVVAFPSVYLSLPKSETVGIFDVFFGALSHDRRRELRRSLSKCYLAPQWPLEDFLRIAFESNFLRKAVKGVAKNLPGRLARAVDILRAGSKRDLEIASLVLSMASDPATQQEDD